MSEGSRRADSAGSISFIYPPNTRYRCVGCGHCCSQQWVIEVEKECLDGLPGDLKSRIKLNVDAEKHPEAAGLLRPDKLGETCSFLDTDKLCIIHKRLSYGAKPYVCRAFPFRFIDTPEGVVVDVSFVCHEVLNRRGGRLEEYRDEIENLYLKSSREIAIDEHIVLKSRNKVTYHAYLLIEDRLLQILSDSQYTVEDRLVAGNIFLYSLSKNIYDDEKIILTDENIQKRLDKFAEKHIVKLYEIAGKGHKMRSRHRQQVFVVTFLTLSSSASQRRTKAGVLISTWINNVKQALNFGRIRVPTFPRRIPIRRLCDIEFDPNDDEIKDLSERYMTLCVFRKVIFAQYGLFRGYNFLLLLYGVTKWLSRVFALEAGRKKVAAEDLAKAIQLVEQQYVRHNENIALLRVESRAMRFVDRLFSDLGFAPIIVKS